MWRRRAWLVTVLLVGLSSALACGSRTGLLVDDTERQDDTTVDANVPHDAGHDAPHDAGFDVPTDTLPPIDAFHRDVIEPRDCPDAAATLVYVVTEQNELFSFYPPTAAFKQVGLIACPADPSATPFSMAVDRQGIARVVFSDGELFRVSMQTAACVATPFVPNQNGITTFGMGYSSDTSGGGETLYIASDGLNGGPNELATIDDMTYVESVVAPFNPPIVAAELTGTGAGDLFAFYTRNGPTDPYSFIGQIDKSTGQVIGETVLPGVMQGTGWAFGFWGGDFYLFTQPNGSVGSNVTRYRPSDGSITVVASLPSTIVGAGVSTCAPQN
jgi:hypothetical protein